MEHDVIDYMNNTYQTLGNINWNDQYKQYNGTNPIDGSNYHDVMKQLQESMIDNEDEGEEEMKKYEVCLPDGNDKAQIGRGCFFLCPTHSGFILYLNPEGVGVEIHCFESFKGVIKFLQDNEILDITDDLVAENI